MGEISGNVKLLLLSKKYGNVGKVTAQAAIPQLPLKCPEIR